MNSALPGSFATKKPTGAKPSADFAAQMQNAKLGKFVISEADAASQGLVTVHLMPNAHFTKNATPRSIDAYLRQAIAPLLPTVHTMKDAKLTLIL
ncbi:MAG: hypothetical protein QXN37_00305 [Candidatus Anstonellaceae archaeon]